MASLINEQMNDKACVRIKILAFSAYNARKFHCLAKIGNKKREARMLVYSKCTGPVRLAGPAMNSQTSQQMIGDQAHLSAPAVQRRIRKLEDAGVITANVDANVVARHSLGCRRTLRCHAVDRVANGAEIGQLRPRHRLLNVLFVAVASLMRHA
jgi:hypothetical protein